MNGKRFFLAGVSAIALVGCAPDPTSTVPLPDVKQFTAADSEKFIASQKGKVMVVNFWATWCGPCRMEIPSFADLQNKYGSQGLQIVGLSIDEIPPGKVAHFAQKNGINYPVHIVGADTLKAWGNFEAIPFTFILDTQGKKVWEHEGYVSSEELEKQIKPLLPPRAPTQS